MQNLSLTLSTLQDPYDDIPSEDVSDEEESDPGSFSEGELRQMRGEDLIVLDGSEGDDLPKTAEPLEGLYTGSYQELSERCRLSRLHCCTGSSHCSLTLLKIEGQTPGSFLSNSPLPKRLIAPALCQVSQHTMLWPGAVAPLSKAAVPLISMTLLLGCGFALST